MTSPHLLAPPTAIITFSLMLSVPVNVSAQTEEAPSIDSPEQCALIDDGIKRLACFDSLYKPTESQAQASESAKEQAEKELANFVELQIELEDNLQITDWGQTRYDAVKDLATQGDVQFQAREFEPALATYREATKGLEALRVAGEAEYANGLSAGNAAARVFELADANAG